MLLTFLMSLAFLANSLSGTPPLPFGVLFGAFESIAWKAFAQGKQWVRGNVSHSPSSLILFLPNICHSTHPPAMLVSGTLCLAHNKYFLFSSPLFEALGNVTRVQLVSVINVKQKNGVDLEFDSKFCFAPDWLPSGHVWFMCQK